jgi:hypothetical protein
MPRIRSSQAGQASPQESWQNTVTERIRAGKVVPIISNRLSNDLVLGGHDKLGEAYAQYIDYPLALRDLPQMSQFRLITSEAITDSWALKSDYVNFVKNRLFDLATTAGAGEDVLAEVEDEFDDIKFSEFCAHLGYPNLEDAAAMPLLVLASLPLPIYVTTSYHDFLEVALKRAGKAPHTEICRWHEGLSAIPSNFDDMNFEPSKETPLVFHLHGFDAYPESLVLAEDDYLEFLVAISQDQGRDTDVVPKRVREAMADSSLILMGYMLQEWDFRALFWSLIKPRPRQPLSVSIQLEPGEEEKQYLQRYLSISEFRPYWGDVQQYAQELRQGLES